MWEKFKNSFHDSETILWARIQVIFGAAWLGLSQADLTPLVHDPRWLTYWIIFNGGVTELLRRSRADDTK